MAFSEEIKIEAIKSRATMMPDQIAIFFSNGLPLGSCSSFIASASLLPRWLVHTGFIKDYVGPIG